MAEELNPFKIAQAQFDEAAKKLGLEPPMCELLRWPRREYLFTIPVKMDNGITDFFLLLPLILLVRRVGHSILTLRTLVR